MTTPATTHTRPIVVALAVLPGRDGTVTFVRQASGVYTRSWLLPGGKVEGMESLAAAAHREAREETGIDPGPLELAAVYELIGRHPLPHHVLLALFTATGPITVTGEGFATDVLAVDQMAPDTADVHPTVRLALLDLGYPAGQRDDIETELNAAGIQLTQCPLAPMPSQAPPTIASTTGPNVDAPLRAKSNGGMRHQ